jgi:hypothetical protein
VENIFPLRISLSFLSPLFGFSINFPC